MSLSHFWRSKPARDRDELVAFVDDNRLNKNSTTLASLSLTNDCCTTFVDNSNGFRNSTGGAVNWYPLLTIQ